MVEFNCYDRYWIPNKSRAFVPCLYKGTEGQEIVFDDGDGIEIRIPVKHSNTVSTVSSEHFKGVGNICDLEEISHAAVLSTVGHRFETNSQIYTRVAQIIIAVNPFSSLPIYSTEIMKKYCDSHEVYDLEPHLFMVANQVIKGLAASVHGANQVVLISGESGAGKTESTKLVLSCVAEALAKNDSQDATQEQIMCSSRILESFGNAMTVRNNNSSRFGKFIDVRTTTSAGGIAIDGCCIRDYLLEGTRVTKQGADERNYHIFFQLLQAKDRLKGKVEPIYEPSHYNYIRNSRHKAPQIDDKSFFEDNVEACHSFGFGGTTQNEIFSIVMGVLSLGNVEFDVDTSSNDDHAKVRNIDAVKDCAKLFGCQHQLLEKMFVERRLKVGGDVTITGRSIAQAESGRDGVARQIYTKVFKHLISLINNTLARGTSDESRFFGVLDIAGFESFDINSIEQLFINLGNETLQAHFNNFIFKVEMEDYQAEGVNVADGMSYQDNSDILALIDSKTSILTTLDEEISVPKASDETFLGKVTSRFGTHPRLVKSKFGGSLLFGIQHFAGEVMYDVSGWLEKNVDKPPEDCVAVFKDSSVGVLREISKVMQQEILESTACSGKKGKAKTVSSNFRASLVALMAKINAAEPHFIRCIKPNADKVAFQFDPPMVMDQLNFSGVFEAVRIRQCGYSYRVPYQDFVRKYKVMYGKQFQAQLATMSDIDAVNAMLKRLPDAVECLGGMKTGEVVVGRTKVLCRSNLKQKLDKLRDWSIVGIVTRLQAGMRGVLARRQFAASKVFHKKVSDIIRSFKFYSRSKGSAVTEFGGVEGANAQIEAMNAFLQEGTNPKMIIKLQKSKEDRLQKLIRKVTTDIELLNFTTCMKPVEIDRMVARAEQLGMGYLDQVKLLGERSKTLKKQLPLSQAVLNISAWDPATSDNINEDIEDMEDLFAALSSAGLLEGKDGWLPELECHSSIELAQKKYHECKTISKMAMFSPINSKPSSPKGAKSGKGSSSHLSPSSSRAGSPLKVGDVDLDAPQAASPLKSLAVSRCKSRRSTCTGVSAEGETMILVSLLAAMDEFDITRLQNALSRAIELGVQSQSVVDDAHKLLVDFENEEFLAENMSEKCVMLKNSRGDKTQNLVCLQNLVDQATALGVAQNAIASARLVLHETVRSKAMQSLVGNNNSMDNRIDRQAMMDAFSNIMNFKSMKKPKDWTGHKGVGNLMANYRADKKAEVMMKHSTQQMLGSLTILPASLDKKALSAFNCVLGLMGDKTMSEVQRDGLIDEVEKLVLSDGSLADELYCQVMKQLTENKGLRSVTAGWKLLLHLLHIAKPCDELRGYWYVFMLKALEDPKIHSDDKNVIEQCYIDIESNTNSAAENTLTVSFQLPDGSTRSVPMTKHTTFEQAIQQLRDLLGVRTNGWKLFQRVLGAHGGDRLLKNSTTVESCISRWKEYEDQTGKKAIFIFKRLFLKDVDLDPAYPYDTKLTWAQAVQEYLKYPIDDRPENFLKVSAMILYVERRHFKDFINQTTKKNDLEHLFPARIMSKFSVRELTSQILELYRDLCTKMPEDQPWLCKLQTYRKMATMKAFGCAWWPVRALAPAAAGDAPVVDAVDIEAIRQTLRLDKDLKIINDMSMTSVVGKNDLKALCVLTFCGNSIGIHRSAGKKGSPPAINCEFSLKTHGMERMIAWNCKGDCVEIVVLSKVWQKTGVADTQARPKIVRLRFASPASVDIKFLIYHLTE